MARRAHGPGSVVAAALALLLMVEGSWGSRTSDQVSGSHNLRRAPGKHAAVNTGKPGDDALHTKRTSTGDVRLLVGDYVDPPTPPSGQLLLSKTEHHPVTEPASYDNIEASRQHSPCSSDPGVTVSSLMFPHMDGCLVDTGSLFNGQKVYSSPAAVIMASVDDEVVDDDGSFFYPRWYARYRTPDGDLAEACFSSQYAFSLHPAEEESWICDSGVDGMFETVTGGKFSVSCGCDNTEKLVADSGAPSDMSSPSLSFPPSIGASLALGVAIE